MHIIANKQIFLIFYKLKSNGFCNNWFGFKYFFKDLIYQILRPIITENQEFFNLIGYKVMSI